MEKSDKDQYLTVSAQPSSTELKIKGSRFIGHIFHVLTKQQAESVYANIRRQYHDASHHCFAYRISENEFRYSDDGEPSGTAGKPIYQILEKKNLIQAIIIVTRYFGGTKLGTGGLTRAYAETARAVLDESKIEKKIRYVIINVETDYDHLSQLLEFINCYHGVVGKSEYTDKIFFSIQIPATQIALFKSDVKAFAGRGMEILD